MSKYLYFKHNGVIRRGEIQAENTGTYLLMYTTKVTDISAIKAYDVPTYRTVIVEMKKTDVYEEVGSVL